MRTLKEVFPIIEEMESWASMGITGHDWGRRPRLASFLDEVKDYREKAEKYEALKQLLTTSPQMEYDDVIALKYEVDEILRGSTPKVNSDEG